MSDAAGPPRRDDGPTADTVARLLRLAGPRPRAPRDRGERVRARVHAHWRRVTRRRRLRRQAAWLGGLALAASLALLVLRPAPPPAAPALVATLEAVAGRLRSAPAQGPLVAVAPGEGIVSGSWLETEADARAALRLLTGASLRVDTDTRLRLVSPTRLELARGAVYVDSGPARRAPVELEVETPLGVAREIGTQFEVRLDDRRMRVRVREGAVRVDRPRDQERTEEAAAGLELELDAAGGLVRRPVAPNGPHWAWTLAIAPPFELEGRRLADFLAWVRRETGWEVRFADPALEVATSDIVLHGSLRGITPDLAPAAVLPTCGLEHAIDQGALVIRAGARARR